jgi:hypothetical protein
LWLALAAVDRPVDGDVDVTVAVTQGDAGQAGADGAARQVDQVVGAVREHGIAPGRKVGWEKQKGRRDGIPTAWCVSDAAVASVTSDAFGAVGLGQ